MTSFRYRAELSLRLGGSIRTATRCVPRLLRCGRTPAAGRLRPAGATFVVLTCVLSCSLSAGAVVHPVPLGNNPAKANCTECHSDLSQGKYVHSAMAMGCTTCHKVTTSSKGATLVTPVSPVTQLCFTCHQRSSDAVQHGPYAEGECVACHSPHASNFPAHLLAAPQDICLGCHTRERLRENRRKKRVTTPWGVTLTFAQMRGWQYLNLNASLTANHPVAGHPVTGPNTASGGGPKEISCLACHQPHASKEKYLMPPTVSSQTKLCDMCHNPLDLRSDNSGWPDGNGKAPSKPAGGAG